MEQKDTNINETTLRPTLRALGRQPKLLTVEQQKESDRLNKYREEIISIMPICSNDAAALYRDILSRYYPNVGKIIKECGLN